MEEARKQTPVAPSMTLAMAKAMVQSERQKKKEEKKKYKKGKVQKNTHYLPQQRVDSMGWHSKPNRNYNFYQMMGQFIMTSLLKGFNLTETHAEKDRWPFAADKLREMKEKDPQYYTYNRQIMNEMIHTAYGTMMPEIKFLSYATTQMMGDDLTSVTGSIQFVKSIRGVDMAGVGLWAAVFDECRPAGPFNITYFPRIIGASGYPSTSAAAANGTAWAIGIIDYFDATAITQTPSALFADTHKIFPLNPYGEERDHGVTRWNGHFIGIPDDTWVSTSALSTALAWFKAIHANNVYGTGTVYWGYIQTGMTLLFRQQMTP